MSNTTKQPRKLRTRNGRVFRIEADLGDAWQVWALGMVRNPHQEAQRLPKTSNWIEELIA